MLNLHAPGHRSRAFPESRLPPLLAAAGAAPPGIRLSIAIAVSVALHAAIVFAPHPPRGAPGQRGFAFSAHLVSAPAVAVERGRIGPTMGLPVPAPEPAAPATRDSRQAAAAPQKPVRTVGTPAQRAAASVTAPDRSSASPANRAPRTPAAAVPPFATHYFPASELDRRPIPQTPVEPDSPPQSPSREGTVILRLFIDEHGSVDEVAVVSAEPAGVFEASALAAFGRARFSPGMLAGVAVKSQMLVEVRYRMKNGPASGRGY